MKNKIKTLVVDDSAVVRQALVEILSSDHRFDQPMTAPDPFVAAEKMKQTAPDVIILDIEMPRMDGLTFLHKIMSQHPIPVIICSSLTPERAETTLKALEYGAVEIIQKPRLGTRQFLEESKVRVRDAVMAASVARVKKIQPGLKIVPKLTADAVIPGFTPKTVIATTEKVVVAGASTGGTEAIRSFLGAMPMDSPGIVIVQHMPEHFTAAFAKRLDGICRITVKEAGENDTVIPGRALIAPGNRHTLLKRSGTRYYVEIKDGPLVCRHRPSVDVLFRSAARHAGQNAIGVIMTGMGDDGSKGLLEMKKAGGYTIAQDEASSVVYGMPHEAVKAGGVCKILPLEGISGEVIRVSMKDMGNF